MPAERFRTKVKRRSLGVAFIAIVAAFISLSIAIYNKAFSTFVDVDLKTNSTGNQLQPDSDVKLRGIIVGSVDTVTANGSVATVKLRLNPDQTSKIPSNVSAQILPKTLFGEQYVSLILPDKPAAHIEGGDVISQDRSKGALEAQTVLAHLYPLLTAVKPADLNATLTAVATALQNNGNRLGQTLVDADRYLKILNGTSSTGQTYTAQIVDDLDKLGKVALEYNGVSPDLFGSLQNLLTSARTVVAKQQQLSNLFTAGATTSRTLGGFLAANKNRIIAVSGQTSATFNLLNQYSPEFTCLFAGINKLYGEVSTIIYDGAIHLAAIPDLDKSQQPSTPASGNFGAYKPGEQPTIVTGYGPNCFGLPNSVAPLDSQGNFQVPSRYVCLNDGAWLTIQGANGKCAGMANNGRSSSAKTTSASSTDPLVGSPAEDAMVNTLIAGQLGTTPDKVSGTSTLLAGPLLRGQKVSVK